MTNVQKRNILEIPFKLLRTLGSDPKAKIMKTMTCNQLGGACDQTFSAETFDEIGMLVSKHAREMVQKGDEAHINAMNEMRSNMTSPDAMTKWMDEKRKQFDALPQD